MKDPKELEKYKALIEELGYAKIDDEIDYDNVVALDKIDR